MPLDAATLFLRALAQDEADWKETDHPRDDDGKFGSGGVSHSFGKTGPHKVPAKLHGVAFSSWKPPTSQKGWQSDDALNGEMFDEPEMPVTQGKKQGAGVIIKEPDGRVWIMHPKGAYGGYNATFPKGGIETGYSPRETAIKEAFEETGLHVALTGYAADLQRDTSIARYYYAKRIGGTPEDHGPEAERVTLAHPVKLHDHLNKPIDREVVEELLGALIPTSKAAQAAKAAPSQGAASGMPAASGPIDTSKMTKVSGAKGSNPGGVYEAANGQKYYAKQSKSLAHASNECSPRGFTK